jgi:predicted RNase H-like HicB family nuclease
MYSLDIKIEIFKEEDLYLAVCPPLNISSYGETEDEAKCSLVEAIEAFIEECDRMGTLNEVLEEAGFIKTGNRRYSRQPLKEENLALAI